MRRPREVSASCDRGAALFPLAASAAFAFSASSANDASSGSSKRTGPRPAPGAPRPRGAARGGDGDRSRDSASLPSKSVLSTTRCVSLFPGRTEIFAALRPASAAFASARCLDVCRARRAWRRGDGGETRGSQTRRRREKTRVFCRGWCALPAEKFKNRTRASRGVRGVRDPGTSGDGQRGAARLLQTRARRTLTCSSVSLNFPTSPLVKSHPGRWSSNCVGFRGLAPTTSSVPACEERDVAPGRLGPATPRFTRISPRRREDARGGNRGCRGVRRASRGFGEPKRFRSLLSRGFTEVPIPDTSFANHPESLFEGPTLA